MSKSSPIAASLIVLLTASAAGAGSRLYLENGTYSGAEDKVTLSRVPVVTSAGKTIYKDVLLKFSVDSQGKLTLTSGYPKITNSPDILDGSFVPGTYLFTSAGKKFLYTLSGPSAATGGRSNWSFNNKDGNCAFTAGWTTGPIAGHPMQARLKAAGISFAGYGYGTMSLRDQSKCDYLPQTLASGNLAGAAASSDGLTIYSFTKAGKDVSAPVTSVSFSRCTTSNC